jgi:hypothetical protein
LQEMCFQKGVNWNNFAVGLKHGRLISRIVYTKDGGVRHKWESVDSGVFTQHRATLSNRIPINE